MKYAKKKAKKTESYSKKGGKKCCIPGLEVKGGMNKPGNGDDSHPKKM